MRAGCRNVTTQQQRPGKKLIYKAHVSSRAEACTLMRELYPLMGERRQARIREILEHVEFNQD